MIKKIKVITILLFFAIVNTQCQNMKTEKNIDLSSTTIKIDSCGLYYKGHRLELGTQLSDWEKVLGKPNRDTNLAFVWDDLGIAIDDWQNEGERGKVAAVFIFFTNLDSLEGKSGQLNFARGWKEFNGEWKKNMLNNKSHSVEENKKMVEEIEEENAPKNFIYPFTIYKGYINLHGFPVGAGMKVAEINSYRKDMTYSGQFGYVDQDIDGVNDSGNTAETFGGDYRAPGTECRGNRLQYYELTYTATGTLEYLKIGYESKKDYEYRKIMEHDIKERMK